MWRATMTLCVVVLLAVGVYAGVTGMLTRTLSINSGISDVPTQVNHQGVVSVNGTRFTGTGQFRFALVEVGSALNRWTNDNSQIGTTNMPTSAVSLPVIDGVYSVQLGDTTLSNMTAVPSSVFQDYTLRLRVWFDDGTNGVQQLSPDQAITSAPYAMVAHKVAAPPIMRVNVIANQATNGSYVTYAILGSDPMFDVPNPGVAVDILLQHSAYVFSNNNESNINYWGRAEISVDGGATWNGEESYIQFSGSASHDRMSFSNGYSRTNVVPTGNIQARIKIKGDVGSFSANNLSLIVVPR